MGIKLMSHLLCFCSVNIYYVHPYRERSVPGGANFCVMPASWSRGWSADRTDCKYDFPAVSMGSTSNQHHYMQG
jgi:hypothetical protein